MENIGFGIIVICSIAIGAFVYYLGDGFWLAFGAVGLSGLILSLIHNLLAFIFGWKKIPFESMFFW